MDQINVNKPTKAPREQPIQNNHKHWSSPKELNKNKDTSKNTGPPPEKISAIVQKQLSPIWRPILPYSSYKNNIEHTHLLDTQEKDTESNENNEIDQGEFHYKTNDDLIPDK